MDDPSITATDIERAERNAATIRRMYDCERRRDLDGWVPLFHPDARQTFPFGDGTTEVAGIDALSECTARKFATRGPMTIRDEVFAMADPRWVFATVDVTIEVAAGRTLELLLWNRFEFDDAGRILDHQEVFDTARMERFARRGAST